MLERFEQALCGRGTANVDVRQANVLELTALPDAWTDYDLIISVSMLEYVLRAQLAMAIKAMHQRLAPEGQMVIVITRRNFITRLVIEKPWHAHRYTRGELARVLEAAGCHDVRFTRFRRGISA